MRIFNELVVLFFIFSVLGWLMEVCLKFIQYHRFINRGFLIGPYCPIYGWGVVTVTVIINHLFPDINTWLGTFIAGMIVCGLLEYFTSFYLEKIFHSRWWDYSNKPLNLHGRIWIGNIILFGLASMFIVKVIDPLYFTFIERFSDFSLMIMAIIIIVLMGCDYVLSHFILADIKNSIDNSELDNTEEIAKAVLNILKDRDYLRRRIEEAYPNLKVYPKHIVKEIKEAKKEMQKRRKALRASINSANEEITKKLLNDYHKAIDNLVQLRNKYRM